MNKAEVKEHLDNIIGADSESLNDIGFSIGLCKVWSTVRKVVIFIQPLIPKKALRLGVAALVLLLDGKCRINNTDND